MVEPKDMTSVWIVEDNLEYRQALSDGLRMSGNYSISEFGSTEDALTAIHKCGVEVLLLDINFSGMSGIVALPRFKQISPGTRIIMLTINDDDTSILSAFERGADGYVAKTAGLDGVEKAIQAIRVGRKHVDAVSLNTLLQSLEQCPEECLKTPLSSREIEVLRLVADGDSRIAIARRLSLSVGTVIAHLRSIHQKLQVKKATQAVVKAIRQRLL